MTDMSLTSEVGGEQSSKEPFELGVSGNRYSEHLYI
jgi:hypothetical protein